MAHRIAKYFGTPSDSVGNPLSWPGTLDGFPCKGPMPKAMKQEEYEDIPLTFDAKVAILQLPKDIEKYQEVIDRVANGWYQLRHEKIDKNEDGTYQVFLQWIEVFGLPAPPKDPTLPGDYDGNR